MRLFPATMVVLAALAGSASAEQPDRAAFLPLAEETRQPEVAVDRSQTGLAVAGRVSLAPASPSEIDTNGDGWVSFDELASHDLITGF